MNLKETIDRELDRLAGGSDSTCVLSVDTTSGRLESEITALDSIGCAFQTFQLTTDRLADASIEHLQKLSEQLSQQLSYLLEPITPIEVDTDRCIVQMRSSPPAKDDDATSYYELNVCRGGDLSLRRYSKTPGQMRQIVPAQVTREVFCRLAADFDAVLN